jgi:hypothetical protein
LPNTRFFAVGEKITKFGDSGGRLSTKPDGHTGRDRVR